jgi:serine/threonine protein kinase
LERKLVKVKDANRVMKNDQVMKIFSTVALALEQIHSQTQTHGNISSDHVLFSHENIYLGGHVNPLVREYWGAKFKQKFLGEWYYLAPEVISGAPYTCQSDMWALGMLLYELVSPHKKPAKEVQKPFTPE